MWPCLLIQGAVLVIEEDTVFSRLMTLDFTSTFWGEVEGITRCLGEAATRTKSKQLLA